MRLKRLLFTAFVTAMSFEQVYTQTFKSEQMSFPRVRAAASEKESSLGRLFERKKFDYPPKRIFIRVFKREQVLELWAAASSTAAFELMKEYRICASSGSPGPKRRQGDGQIPEGFYQIDRFNPVSNYHLSLGINYPNRSDRVLGGGAGLGGDIFIHGGCATIGCVPITDEGIKELYLIAVEARSAGQAAIPVHIFPARLDEKGLSRLRASHSENKDLIDFWSSLKAGFDYFEMHRKLPTVTVNKRGRYVFSG
jgi:murein L,D-transpeptidase YafK